MLNLVTPPTSFVNLPEARDHLRVDHTDHNTMIDRLIKVAIADLDGPTGRLGRALGEQVWDWEPDDACRALRVPLPPLREVVSVTVGGVAVAADSYSVRGIGSSAGGMLVAADRYTWPVDMTVRFRAGYPAVPEPIRQAVLLIVGDLYASGGEKVEARYVEEPAIARLLNRFWMPVV